MLKAQALVIRRGSKVVIDGAEFTLNPGEKASLVGRNGAGKSSLFALLAGRLQADGGDVHWPPRWQMAEVAQDMPEGEEAAADFVLQGDIPLQRAHAALAAAEDSGDGLAMADAHVALQEAGAFDARARAESLLLGLGFQRHELNQPIGSFSGGWRMRAQLARALMCPADLLLLDEPTNHLDLDALVWLEGWLKRHPATMIVISHDREFLDAVTQVTLHLDEGKVVRYGGNYTAFETQRAERLRLQQAAFSKQQDRIAHLQKFIDRFKAKATKARQAQSRVKALDRMERIAPVLAAADFAFEFEAPQNLPNPMLVLREVRCGYRLDDDGESAQGEAPRERVILPSVTRTVMAGQRIGILGANGQGKSTLVKTIAGDLPPLAGTLTEGKGLAIGYFAQQEMDLLSPDDTPLQRMVRLAREVSPQAREQELRNFLGRFRFEGEMVQQRIGTLSGGERARLVLATLVWRRPNLLLLDEPTNHLDLNTREALSMALNEFEGTVMMVSHDRALLREVCDGFWLVTQGGVHDFDGDIDDYQRWLLEAARCAAAGLPPPAPKPLPEGPVDAAAETPSRGGRSGGAPPAAPAAAPAAAAPKDDRKARAQARQKLAERTRPMRSEITQIDARMAVLTQERGEVETLLAQPGLGGSDAAEGGRRLNHILAETAQLEERWLELQQAIEDAERAE